MLILSSSLSAKNLYIKVQSLKPNSAQNLINKINNLGYGAYSSKYKDLRRVYAGPFSSINDASSALRSIKQNLSSSAYIVKLSATKKSYTPTTTPLKESPKQHNKWKINAGTMFVVKKETTVQMGIKDTILAASINTVDQLGMENNTNIIYLDGHYRFTNQHSISFSYFAINSSGDKIVNQDIEWEDKIIHAGASVDSYLNMNIINLSYAYSFYHSKSMEFALTAGLHATYISVGLDVKANVDGNNGDYSQAFKSDESIPLPLPVFGFKGEYAIVDKRVFVNYATSYFFLKYDKYKGSFVSTSIGLEYRFMDNIGIGAGYNTNRLYAEGLNEEKQFKIEDNLSGFLLYATFTY